MAATVSVRVVLDPASIAELKDDPRVREYIHETAEDVAQEMAVAAPKRSGGGSQSIHARDSRARGAEDAGWDALHYYMGFPDLGTKYQPAQRFAENVLDHYMAKS